MEKILKYLLKGQMINATMNVSFKSITDGLDVNILVGESYEVIYSKTSSNNQLQRSISWNMRHSSDKIETADYGNMLTESADKM